MAGLKSSPPSATRHSAVSAGFSARYRDAKGECDSLPWARENLKDGSRVLKHHVSNIVMPWKSLRYGEENVALVPNRGFFYIFLEAILRGVFLPNRRK